MWKQNKKLQYGAQGQRLKRWEKKREKNQLKFSQEIKNVLRHSSCQKMQNKCIYVAQTSQTEIKISRVWDGNRMPLENSYSEFHVWTTMSWHVQLGEKGDLQRNLFWEWASWGSDQRHRVWCRQDSGSGGSCKTGVPTCQADNHRCTHLAPSLLWVFLWVQTLLNKPYFPFSSRAAQRLPHTTGSAVRFFKRETLQLLLSTWWLQEKGEFSDTSNQKGKRV